MSNKLFSNKVNFAPVALMSVIIIGVILEIVGGVMSSTTAIGFNFDLSPLMIVGIVLVVVGFVAHFPLKILSKKLNINAALLDIEAILMIIAIFFAVAYLVCVIVWPVVFPANG